jgi:hypothetical protein
MGINFILQTHIEKKASLAEKKFSFLGEDFELRKV